MVLHPHMDMWKQSRLVTAREETFTGMGRDWKEEDKGTRRKIGHELVIFSSIRQ